MKNFMRSQNSETIRDKIGHLLASTALTGAAITVAPATVVALGYSFAAGLNYLRAKASLSHYKKNLSVHPKKHKFSPNLQGMVNTLFEKSGLDGHKAVIYNLDAEDEKDEKKEKDKKRRERAGEILGLPNAAAFSLGEPIIMASDSLLQVLNDDEEYAVLGHEFAHVMGQHVPILIAAQVATAGASLAAQATKIAEWINAGNDSMIASSFAYLAMASGVKTIGDIINNKKDGKTKEQNKLKTYAAAHMLGSIASAVVTSVYNPAYPVIYAAAQTIGYGGVLLNKSLSRSFEYQCDRNAVELLDANPLALITALRKITSIQQQEQEKQTGKKADGSLTSRWRELHSTHPATHKRIQRLAEIARKQGISEQKIQDALTKELTMPRTDTIRPHVIARSTQRVAGNLHSAPQIAA